MSDGLVVAGFTTYCSLLLRSNERGLINFALSTEIVRNSDKPMQSNSIDRQVVL